MFRSPRPGIALLALAGGALAFGAWTGFPVLGDAIVPLMVHDTGVGSLASRNMDRPLYGWLLQATVAVIGVHRLAWVAIGLALWGLLAWLTARLFVRVFPERSDRAWLPALLVLSPIVVQSQFESLLIVYSCVAPVALVLVALLAGLPAGDPASRRRSVAVFLLAALAGLVSEYGVAAGCAGVVLLLVLNARWRATWLGAGTAAGAILFSLTARAATRPDVTVAAQLPKLRAAPLLAMERWLSGIWYATVGAYGAEAGQPLLDPESRSTIAIAAIAVLGAALAFLAARTAAADGPSPGMRPFAGLLLAVAVAILPVAAAGRPAAFHESWVGEYDTRFLLPALPFAAVLLAGVLSTGMTRSMAPAAAALLGFLCVEAGWRGALQAMRSQQWAEELGRAVLPVVREGGGMTVVVGADDPRKRWGAILTGKMTMSWPVEDARRVFALPQSRAIRLIGDRATCRTPDALAMTHETRWAQRSGPVHAVVWVPGSGTRVGPLERYCAADPSP